MPLKTSFEDFLYHEDNDNNIVTPETLAWKLLMDEDCKDYANEILPYVINDDENKNMSNYDNLSGRFEILITIYMEMIYIMLKMNYLNSLMNEENEIPDNIDFEKNFVPDLSSFVINDLIDIFRDKMKKIKIFLSVREIIDDDKTNNRDFGSQSDYYCKILLKDMSEGKTYFWNNRHRIEPDKRYTFIIRNDVLQRQNKIDDFYAVCVLPNMKVRISFSQINVHIIN